MKKAKAFDQLDAGQRHKLRIAVKKFRYVTDFVANVFPSKKSKRRRIARNESSSDHGKFPTGHFVRIFLRCGLLPRRLPAPSKSPTAQALSSAPPTEMPLTRLPNSKTVPACPHMRLEPADVSVACEPSLWPLLPSLRGNGFWTPETEGPELPLKRSFFPAETAGWPRASQNAGYSSNHGKFRLAWECVVGLGGLEPPTRPL
jgi:hypothetical protein